MARKRKRQNEKPAKTQAEETPLPAVRMSDEPIMKKPRWVNKERVLVFSSRGILHRDRHLMMNFRLLMPHAKAETKMDRKDQLFVINEMADMKNCSKCLYFESKKKKDLYLWAANTPKGPSAKFLVENVHTMEELKMTGNCLKGSRPLLSFDKAFDTQPHWALLKELFIQIFGTPRNHPKSQPFVDHVFAFSIKDNRIWFRNYQILEEHAELAEIGPRMVLNPIRIFQGSFGGPTLFLNQHYVSPNESRRVERKKAGSKYVNRIMAKKSLEDRRPEVSYDVDPTDEVFQTT